MIARIQKDLQKVHLLIRNLICLLCLNKYVLVLIYNIVHNISFIFCNNETGGVCFSILKRLIQLIALSTSIQRLTTSLVFLTSAEVI